MTVFNVIEKQKSRFLTSGFFDIIAKPKVNIHSKIQSLSQPRSDFFSYYPFPGPSHSCLFQCILALSQFSTSQLHCMLRELHGRIFDSIRSLPPLFFIFVLVLVHSHSNLPQKFCACCDFQLQPQAIGHDFLCSLSTTFHGNPRVTKSCGLFTIFIYRKSLETVKCFGRQWVNYWKLLGVLLIKVSLFYQNLPDMEF